MIFKKRAVQTFLVAGLFLAVTVYGLTACMDAAAPKNLSGTNNNISAGSTVVDADYIGAYPSLTVAPDGRLHASYYARYDWGQDGGGALRHAVLQNDGRWTAETVDGDVYDTTEDVGQYSSIRADDQGRLHLAYWDVTRGELKYTTQMPDSGLPWDPSQTVASLGPGVVCPAALDLDAQGNVYIVYCSPTGVYYARKNSQGIWERIPIWPGEATLATFEFDDNNNMHLAFFDPTGQTIKYIFGQAGGPFQSPQDVVAPGGNDTRLELALDASGNPHIVFYDIAAEELKHAFVSSGGWNVETIDNAVGNLTYVTDGAPVLGYLHLSSLIDQSGELHVSYYEGTNQDLKHAVLTAGGWTYDTIFSEGDVGRTSAMAEDADGTIHIIYRDSTNNDLKYAYLQ